MAAVGVGERPVAAPMSESFSVGEIAIAIERDTECELAGCLPDSRGRCTTA
jgi:hypothetical protein